MDFTVSSLRKVHHECIMSATELTVYSNCRTTICDQSQVWMSMLNTPRVRDKLIVERKKRCIQCGHIGKRDKDAQKIPEVRGFDVKLKFKQRPIICTSEPPRLRFGSTDYHCLGFSSTLYVCVSGSGEVV